jgi:hypothetical protein
LSIETGIVPDKMKIARIIPIFKSGDNRLFSNYRPISVLPIFSKILERVVHNRLMNYINNIRYYLKINMALEKIIQPH